MSLFCGDLIASTDNLVLTVTGTANNAAWMACLDAIDQIRKHPRYKQMVKGGTSPAREFGRCFNMLHHYERQLLYGTRFFHVADMDALTRKVYGSNFTDADYYDYWAAFGFAAYTETKPFFTSLVNKVRLAYLHHGNANPEIIGWAMAAKLALDIAAELWQSAMESCYSIELKHEPTSANVSRWQKRYRCFNLQRVAEAWLHSIDVLDPDSDIDAMLSEQEQSNLKMGYEQLAQEWMKDDTLYGARIKTAEDFADIFRTHGEMKKVMRQFADMRDVMADTLNDENSLQKSVNI